MTIAPLVEYCYVATTPEDKPCKIGKTSERLHRLSVLQTGNHLRLHLHFLIAVRNGLKVESAAHTILRSQGAENTGGGRDWFDIDSKGAVAAVMTALSFDDRSSAEEIAQADLIDRCVAEWEKELRIERDPWETFLREREPQLSTLQDGVGYNEILRLVGVPPDRNFAPETKRLSSVLRMLGWERRLVTIDAGRYWRYFPPRDNNGLAGR